MMHRVLVVVLAGLAVEAQSSDESTDLTAKSRRFIRAETVKDLPGAAEELVQAQDESLSTARAAHEAHEAHETHEQHEDHERHEVHEHHEHKARIMKIMNAAEAAEGEDPSTLPQYAANANSNSTLASIASGLTAEATAGLKKLEYEFSIHDFQSSPKVSKVRFAMVSQFFVFGFFGLDRCFMHQYMLGVIKAITIGGGFGAWAVFDYIVVFWNMMKGTNAMDSFGFTAKFGEKSELDDAFWLSLFLFFVSIGMISPIVYNVVMWFTGQNEKMWLPEWVPACITDSLKKSEDESTEEEKKTETAPEAAEEKKD